MEKVELTKNIFYPAQEKACTKEKYCVIISLEVDMDKKMLNIREAAARIGISTKTLRRYIAEGRVQAYHKGIDARGPGRGYQFRAEDVDNFAKWHGELRPHYTK